MELKIPTAQWVSEQYLSWKKTEEKNEAYGWRLNAVWKQSMVLCSSLLRNIPEVIGGIKREETMLNPLLAFPRDMDSKSH